MKKRNVYQISVLVGSERGELFLDALNILHVKKLKGNGINYFFLRIIHWYKGVQKIVKTKEIE